MSLFIHSPRSLRRASFSFAAASLLTLAYAQTQPAPLYPAAPDDEVIKLDRFAVSSSATDSSFNQSARTASRLGLSLRETPASVEILDALALSERGARTTLDAINTATGFSGGYTGGSPQNLSTRGFTNNGIRYLYDGTAAGSLGMTARPSSTFNYERIEILRGPAGVLTGEGSIGGTVNFVTKAPRLDASPSSDLFASYGSFDSWRVGLGTGQVLSPDRVAFRADYTVGEDGSRIDDFRLRTAHFTGGLLVAFNERVRLTLQADLSADEADNFYWGSVLVNGRLEKSLRRANYNKLDDDIFDSRNHWWRAHLDVKLSDAWSLRNSTHFFDSFRNWRNAEDYTYIPADPLAGTPAQVSRDSWGSLDHDQQSWGNRLAASHVGQLAGLASRTTFGFDYAHTDFASARNGFPSAPQLVDPANPATTPFFHSPAVIEKFLARVVEDTTTAVYAENQLTLLPALKLVSGLRYDDIDMKWSYLNAPSSSTPPTHRANTWNPLSWRLGTTYDVTSDTTLYAQYANASEPGGTLWLLNAQQSQLDLTRGRQVELGLKQAIPALRAELHLAAYQITKTNIFVPDPAAPSNRIQVGRQQSRGLDLGLVLRPVERWQIEANAAYVDAEFKNFTEGNPPVSRSGNTSPFVPDFVANLGVRHQLTNALSLGGWLRHVDSVFTNNANTAELPAYTTLNLDATWRVNQNLRVTARVRNVTDEFYATWAYRSGAQVTLGEPRTYELSASYKF